MRQSNIKTNPSSLFKQFLFGMKNVLRNDQYSSFNGLYHLVYTSEDHWLTWLTQVHDLQDKTFQEENVGWRKERNEIELSKSKVNPSLRPVLWIQSLCPWDRTWHWSRKLWLLCVLQLNTHAVYYNCLSSESKLEKLSTKSWPC